MKQEFRHHPDGWIYINDVELTLEEFLQFEPDYKLPEFFTGREYFPGKAHRLYTDKNEIYLPDRWEDGDRYITRYEEFKQFVNEKPKQFNEDGTPYEPQPEPEIVVNGH